VPVNNALEASWLITQNLLKHSWLNNMADPLDFFKRTRDLYPSEKGYFKANPQVGGMATEDQYVVLNPYSKLSPQEKNAVHVNEAARLYMNQNGVPNVSLTREQEQNLTGLGAYANADPQYKKATMMARILSGDPTGGIPTMEQSEAIKPMLFLRGLFNK
jgi:hypothetical protein